MTESILFYLALTVVLAVGAVWQLVLMILFHVKQCRKKDKKGMK